MWTRDDFRTVVPAGIVGMIHLLPLPGSPRWRGDMGTVRDEALRDAATLQRAGFGAVLVENYHDVPFYPRRVPAATVAALTAVVSAICDRYPSLAVGVNVLRNDAVAALAVAAATDARFVRVNVHTGAAVTDQGPLTGRAWETLRLRAGLGIHEVGILADLRVKHAAPLAARDLADEARDLRLRGLADAVIVSGPATGAAGDPGDLQTVRTALPDCPLLVGSGANANTIASLLAVADGCIVGTSLQEPDPVAGRPVVDATRARTFVNAACGRKD